MTTNLPAAVLESADITAITQLILREREGRDLCRWEQMEACFFHDSLVRISWFRGSGADFVKGSIEMARNKLFAKHRLGPILVTLAGDRAIGRLGAVVDLPVTVKDVGSTLSAYVRLIYRVERRSGRWGIVGFDSIYDRDELTPAIPGQLIFIDESELRQFRPSYRMLAYYQSSAGYNVPVDLPGDDRPDLVEALIKEVYDWAGLTP